MTKKFNIGGIEIELTLDSASQIHQWYEAACTAGYLMEEYDISEDEAMELGYEVREKMNKYDLDELDAIEECMNERDYS